MKRACTRVLETMNDTENTTHAFPLTPALSPGEREHSSPPPPTAEFSELSQRGGRRKALEHVYDGCRLFPLPEGEGQGEGERGFSTLSGATSV